MVFMGWLSGVGIARLQIGYTLCWSIVLGVIWLHTSSGMAKSLKELPGTLCNS